MKAYKTPPLLDADRCLLRNSAILSLTKPDAAGLLFKRANISGWYKYWFSLKGSQLLYFETAQSGRRGLLVGTISLFRHKLTIVNSLKRRREFEICDGAGKLHVLRAGSDAELHWWVQIFSVARNKIPPAQPIAAPPASAGGSGAGSGGGAGNGGVGDAKGGVAESTPSTRVEPHLKVDHVLCVVHGIGVSADILAANTQLLQENYEDVMARVLPDVEFRVEVLVIHWRDALTALDVHRKLRSVVPVAPAGGEGNPLREFMVHRIVDYVYYTHERYRQHIMREVARQLNERVAEFRKRRPEFTGGISVLGHSLGAAIVYDLMCRRVHDDQVLLEAEGMRLAFDGANLFCVGNPLGTLLGLDPTLGLGADMRSLPFRVFNVFKLHDPIATRLEPHADEAYAGVWPVTVPCMANMGLRESTTEWLGRLWSGQRREGETAMAGEGAAEADGEVAYVRRELQEEIVRSHGGWRMDYALQVSSTMEEVSTAWSALKAHTEYWGSRDLMLMMVSCMIKGAFGLRDDEEVADVEGFVVDEDILRKAGARGAGGANGVQGANGCHGSGSPRSSYGGNSPRGANGSNSPRGAYSPRGGNGLDRTLGGKSAKVTEGKANGCAEMHGEESVRKAVESFVDEVVAQAAAAACDEGIGTEVCQMLSTCGAEGTEGGTGGGGGLWGSR